jgi:hypothetical protein
MVWRQFCGCLSEGAAHLPTTVSQLLLEALLIADLRSELNTYLAPAGFVYLEFSWVQLPLLQVFPSPSTLGEVALHPPSSASVFIYSSRGKCPFPPLQWCFPHPATFTSFPAQGCWVGAATLAFSGWLVYLQFCEGLPLPPSLALRAPHPLCYMSFFVVVVYYSVCLFFLFFPWVGVSLYRWHYFGSTVCRSANLVVCILWADRSWCGSPPSFSIYCGVGMLCMGWGCGGVRVLPLFGGFSCKVYPQHLSKILLRNHAFCFLPVVTILKSELFLLLQVQLHL